MYRRCISKVAGEHQDNWDDCFDPVLFGIRTAVQESTKYTPFYLMHGREARFPLEVEKSIIACDVEELGSIEDTIDRLTTLQQKIFVDAKKNIDSRQTKQKDQYKRRKGIGEDVRFK